MIEILIEYFLFLMVYSMKYYDFSNNSSPAIVVPAQAPTRTITLIYTL